MLIDFAVLACIATGVLLGWHEGLARAAWGFTGTVAGTAVGLLVVPAVLERYELSVWVSLAAVTLMVIFHLFITSTFPLAVPLEWRSRLECQATEGVVWGEVFEY